MTMSARQTCRILLVAGLASLLLFGVRAGVLWPKQIMAIVGTSLDALRGLGPMGVAIFAALQLIVAVSGIIPAAMLGVAAGAIYGLMTGFIVAAISTLAGALLAFLLARSLLRDSIDRALAHRPRLHLLDTVVARDGWRVVCLMRMSPVMPFSITSYALGLSSIGTRDYMIGTMASLPALFGYVFLGTLADAGLTASSHGASPLRWTLLGIGAMATAILTWRIGHLVTKSGILSAPQIPPPHA